ncbi:hypothetical protein M378DRAFT_155514 [Amanita muscaria Koide BX008]|uniref:Uncharacterized protein n=1 Tax=Amanita muscaria (strain Koide BX008) TaxID=946122 RepID=A0A0C2XM26_AMAMK|nr:hypothetical protein M378DRAFT_155514 [Amanita muscaria Koide BX008]
MKRLGTTMRGTLATVSSLDVIELTDSEEDSHDHANESHLCGSILDLTSSQSDNEDDGQVQPH